MNIAEEFITPVADVIEKACGRIAPNWPLDRFIAVNPYWGWIDRPFDEAALDLARASGTSLYMPAEFYRDAWERKAFSREDLQHALDEQECAESPEVIIEALAHAPTPSSGLPLLCQVGDTPCALGIASGRESTIVHHVGQFCAAYFDERQAEWGPSLETRLYPAWRAALAHDHGVELLLQAPGITQRAARLPDEAGAAVGFILEALDVPQRSYEAFLTAVLMQVGGWAAWCAYLRWEARQRGRDDQSIVDLLAIRLAWEYLFDDGERSSASTWARWQSAFAQASRAAPTEAHKTAFIVQRAFEYNYQRSLARAVAGRPPAVPPERPDIQAAFCIDVRSEVFRRALEDRAEDLGPQVQTIGFAGFFGLPIAYTPLATHVHRPQLPGLLAPTLSASETLDDQDAAATLCATRQFRLTDARARDGFRRLPASAFTLVETLGLGYAFKLLRRSWPAARPRTQIDHTGLRASEASHLRLRLASADGEGTALHADLAENVLRGMTLTHHFARLVLLAGHGSQTSNNPHAASLDCGACCGQTGEINARALAGLLNDRALRITLSSRGIVIPDTTCFVAGLHNTTTDEVEILESDRVPPTHAQDLKALRRLLEEAGTLARRERAPALGLGHLARQPKTLLRAMRERANDWSQTRPEWGLAGNAAFIVAPRAHTRGLDLQGRTFLHDYDWSCDFDGRILELIMTAPMVVTHWINMQYYASTVDNRRFGSGNKLLHNVVGGHLGVFEGNGGDLRIGLPMQSLHDGTAWVHTPLRLSVLIAAPREMIERVMRSHAVVRHLVANRWLYLLQWNPEDSLVYLWRDEQWIKI
ncbi:MAG: DUF2309 domain-containing protein [Betaproteobacteria bacterium]